MTNSASEERGSVTRSTITCSRHGPPSNELPALLDAEPAMWHGRDIHLAATAFLVYSTGAEFIVLGRSRRLPLHEGVGYASAHRGFTRDDGGDPGGLRIGVHDATVTPLGADYHEHDFRASYWVALPADGHDLILFAEWYAAGIQHSEHRIPGGAIAEAATRITVLWPTIG